MVEFLHVSDLPKWNKKMKKNLNRSIMSNKIEATVSEQRKV
jgi:hypothetical protein